MGAVTGSYPGGPPAYQGSPGRDLLAANPSGDRDAEETGDLGGGGERDRVLLKKVPGVPHLAAAWPVQVLIRRPIKTGQMHE